MSANNHRKPFTINSALAIGSLAILAALTSCGRTTKHSSQDNFTHTYQSAPPTQIVTPVDSSSAIAPTASEPSTQSVAPVSPSVTTPTNSEPPTTYQPPTANTSTSTDDDDAKLKRLEAANKAMEAQNNAMQQSAETRRSVYQSEQDIANRNAANAALSNGYKTELNAENSLK